MDKSFSVVITGIRQGASTDDVVSRISRIFQLDDVKLQGLAQGKSVTVEENISETEAAKLEEILVRSGCIVDVTDKGQSTVEACSSEEDPVTYFKIVQEKVAVLLESAEDLTGSNKTIQSYNIGSGGLLLLSFTAGWYALAWYWGFLIMCAIAVVITKLGSKFTRAAAEKLFTVLRPGFIDLVGKEGAMGLAAVSALRQDSVLRADWKLVGSNPAQQLLKEFLIETKSNREDLFHAFLDLEEFLKSIPEILDEKIVKMNAQLEQMQQTREKVQRQLEAIDTGEAFKEEPEAGAVIVKAYDFSYRPDPSMYSACLLKPDQSDIIMPPVPAGNLRYIKPGSKRILNSFDIGSDVTVAFTDTHFIMALGRSVVWRIGYDCIHTYKYSCRKDHGEILSSGREHELDFAIGLEHTYTNTTSRKTSAFGFGIDWYSIQGLAEYCVPLIKEAISAAGFPTCPACGGMNLRTGTWDVATGIITGGTIPSDTAVCSDCGIEMQYACSAGGWMAKRDEDVCRMAPPLSADRAEMLVQAEELVSRAENMIYAVDVTRDRFFRKLEEVKAELKNANLGLTLSDMRYTHRQRQAQQAGKNLQFEIKRVEFAQGVSALMFNFQKAHEQLQNRLRADITSLSYDDSAMSERMTGLLEKSMQCLESITGLYGVLAGLG